MVWERSRREKHLFFAVLIIALAAGAILSVFQIINRGKYKQLSESNRVRMIIEPAPRGRIISSDGYDIASTGNLLSLYLDVGIVNPEYQSLKDIAQIGDISIDSLSKLIRNAKRYGQSQVRLKSDTDINTVSLLEENANLYPGILIKKTVLRVYPFNDLYTHPLGYVGNINNEDYEELLKEGYAFLDFTGQTGIEKYYDKMLKGENGIKYYEIDSNGRMVQQINIENSRDPLTGSDLYTSLNHNMQIFADSVTSEAGIMEFFIMESSTGRIISMISKPTFNPNIFIYGIKRDVWEFMSRNDNSPFTNRCIETPIMPGMLFRITAILSGLQNNIIDTATVFQPCTGSIIIGNREFRCHSEHGQLNLNNAFIENCSIYFDQMNLKIGIDRFIGILMKYNANGFTGIDCSNESSGFIPDRDYFNERYGRGEWGNAEISSCMSGLTDAELTLLQMTVMLNTMINGGKRVVPSIVDSVIAGNGKREYVNDINYVTVDGFDESAANRVKQMLVDNVNSDDAAILGAKIEDGKAGALFYNFDSIAGNHSVMFLFYPSDDPEIIIACGVSDYENVFYRLPHLMRTILKYYVRQYADTDSQI